jgi:hypothetical protein
VREPRPQSSTGDVQRAVRDLAGRGAPGGAQGLSGHAPSETSPSSTTAPPPSAGSSRFGFLVSLSRSTGSREATAMAFDERAAIDRFWEAKRNGDYFPEDWRDRLDFDQAYRI